MTTTRRDGMYAHGPGSGFETDSQQRARIAARRLERIDWEIAERRDMAGVIARAKSLASGPLRSYTMASSDAECIREMEEDYARRCAVSPEDTIDAEDATNAAQNEETG